MFELAARFAGLCLALAGAEMLHGIARVRFLIPRVGRPRAQQIGIVTGLLLAFGVCFLVVPTLGVTGRGPLLAVGAGLSAFMAAFDAVMGRFVARRPWRAVAEDFNPLKGNYLLVGLCVLVFVPGAVMAISAR